MCLGCGTEAIMDIVQEKITFVVIHVRSNSTKLACKILSSTGITTASRNAITFSNGLLKRLYRTLFRPVQVSWMLHLNNAENKNLESHQRVIDQMKVNLFPANTVTVNPCYIIRLRGQIIRINSPFFDQHEAHLSNFIKVKYVI